MASLYRKFLALELRFVKSTNWSFYGHEEDDIYGGLQGFFGLKEFQTSMQFAQEIKALTEIDRAEIRTGLTQNGYEILQAA